MRKFYALFLFVLFGISIGYSQEKATFTSTAAGLWSDGATWVGGTSPGTSVGAGDVVNISHNVKLGATGGGYAVSNSGTVNVSAGGLLEVGYTVAIPFPPTVYDGTLTVASGAYLNLSGGELKMATGGSANSATIVSSGGRLVYVSGTVTNSSEMTINGTYNDQTNGGSIPANMIWNQTTGICELSGLTNSLPSMPVDDMHNLKINSSGMTSNISLNNAFVSLFDNVEITHTGNYFITGDPGNVVTYSGNLTIQSNGKMQINPTDKITVTGTLTNTSNSNLVIKSTSAGTGSLISGSSPNGTLECYITKGDWHLIGPPNGSLSASPAFLSGYMQTWADGDPGSWTVQEGNPALIRGRGAAYYFISSNFTADLVGTLDGSAETESGMGNAGGGDDGYHLLANPFPCAVDLDACAFSAGISTSYQVYNGDSYVTVAGNVMEASQGFFIQVGSGQSGQSVTFQTAGKTHSNGNISKNIDEEVNLIQFALTDNDGKSNDELIIRFNDEATMQYDLKFDGHKIIGNTKAGEIMAQITDSEFACVLGIPFPNNETTVTVNFKKGDASEYTINLERNLLSNMEVTLEDAHTGFVVDLSTTPIYTFTAEDSQDGRFLIHFKSATSVEEINEIDDVKIWNFRDQLYVQQDYPENAEVFVYDISGKLMFSQKLDVVDLQKISLNQPKGAYLIKFVSGDKSYSIKIIK